MAKIPESTVIKLTVKPVVDGKALRKALADELRRVANDIENVGYVPLKIGTTITNA